MTEAPGVSMQIANTLLPTKGTLETGQHEKIGSTCYRTSRSIGATNARTETPGLILLQVTLSTDY
jgi:hypothetical protein